MKFGINGKTDEVGNFMMESVSIDLKTLQYIKRLEQEEKIDGKKNLSEISREELVDVVKNLIYSMRHLESLVSSWSESKNSRQYAFRSWNKKITMYDYEQNGIEAILDTLNSLKQKYPQYF